MAEDYFADTSFASFPGSAWEHTVCQAPPGIGRQCQSATTSITPWRHSRPTTAGPRLARQCVHPLASAAKLGNPRRTLLASQQWHSRESPVSKWVNKSSCRR